MVGLLIALPRLQPPTGTLLVLASARSPESLAPTTVSLHGSAGWTAIGSVSGSVPAAPEQRELLALPVAVGTYYGVRLGLDEEPVAISVVAGQVEPLLLGIESRHLISGAAYAGNDQVNLGLGELSGKFWPMPPFALTDQAGSPFDNATIAGTDHVNVGRGERSGKFWQMPPFALNDQVGSLFDNASIAGKDVVIAAFHT